MPYTFAEALNLSITGILVVLVILTILALILTTMGKILAFKNPQNASTVVVEPQVSVEETVHLFDVPDKTAAMIMAIVADETKIPLNELYFQSIKEIKE